MFTITKKERKDENRVFHFFDTKKENPAAAQKRQLEKERKIVGDVWEEKTEGERGVKQGMDEKEKILHFCGECKRNALATERRKKAGRKGDLGAE